MTSKAERALAIYQELAGDPDIRKKFIARCKSELGMGDAGAATYYQNTKTKAAGGTVKVYGQAAKKATAAHAAAPINDDPWSVILVKDEQVADCAVFRGEQAARDAFDKLGEHNKENSEVVRGSLAIGSPYVLGG